MSGTNDTYQFPSVLTWNEKNEKKKTVPLQNRKNWRNNNVFLVNQLQNVQPPERDGTDNQRNQSYKETKVS